MAKKHSNSKRDNRIIQLSKPLECSSINNLKGCLSFSLYFFDGSQEAGQDINQWDDEQKNDLFIKLKEFSKNTKKYWLNARCGSGGLKILAVYGQFPNNTDFKCPNNIPDNISWARFRMNNMMRIIGFFINEEEATARNLSSDVFYIVFLDKDHRFYKTEEK